MTSVSASDESGCGGARSRSAASRDRHRRAGASWRARCVEERARAAADARRRRRERRDVGVLERRLRGARAGAPGGSSRWSAGSAAGARRSLASEKASERGLSRSTSRSSSTPAVRTLPRYRRRCVTELSAAISTPSSTAAIDVDAEARRWWSRPAACTPAAPARGSGPPRSCASPGRGSCSPSRPAATACRSACGRPTRRSGALRLRGAQRLHRPVGVPKHAPRVARELVAHALERVAQPLERVRSRSGAVGVEQQRAELGSGVGPARAATRRRERSERAPSGRRRAPTPSRRSQLLEVLARGRDQHQPQQVLGALGVAARPEHVLERARRQHGDGASAKSQRCDVGEPLVRVGRRALEHPDVLA